MAGLYYNLAVKVMLIVKMQLICSLIWIYTLLSFFASRENSTPELHNNAYFFAVKKSGKKIALTIWLRVFCYFPHHPREKWRATEREHRAGHLPRPWGGGNLGLSKVKFSQSPPFECYFTAVIPPNNFWWLLWFPPPSSFSKKIWVIPSLNPSKLLSDPPFWVLSYDWSPLLFSLKASDPP